jgi:hypothetical protein
MPEYEALVNELESEEDEDFCEYLGIYVEENS